MNKYGGYEWRENERSGCYMEGFEIIDEETFVKTTTQLKGRAFSPIPAVSWLSALGVDYLIVGYKIRSGNAQRDHNQKSSSQYCFMPFLIASVSK